MAKQAAKTAVNDAVDVTQRAVAEVERKAAKEAGEAGYGSGMAAHAAKEAATGAGTGATGAGAVIAKAIGPVSLVLEVGASIGGIVGAAPAMRSCVIAHEVGGFVCGRAVTTAAATLGSMICLGVGTLVGCVVGGMVGKYGGSIAADMFVGWMMGQGPK
jgi:hypothetical protein